MTGYQVNPFTSLPYQPVLVPRADFAPTHWLPRNSAGQRALAQEQWHRHASACNA